MKSLNKITSTEEKENACERRNPNSEKYAFIMRESFFWFCRIDLFFVSMINYIKFK
jgi:hypothetical protein